MTRLNAAARLAPVLLTILFLAGCQKAERPSYGDVEKIGVVSLAGNAVYNTKLNVLIGEDERINYVPDWHLARYIESLIAEYIHQYGTARVIPLAIDHRLVFAHYHDSSPGMFGKRFNYGDVETTIEKSARDAEVDIYLTVEPMDRPPSAPRLTGGLGFMSNRRLGYDRTCFYNLMKINVRRVGQPGAEYGIYKNDTCIKTDIEWRRDFHEYDETIQRSIEAGLKSVIARDIQLILYSLGFFQPKEPQ